MSLIYRVESAARFRDYAKKKLAELLAVPTADMNPQQVIQHNSKIKRASHSVEVSQAKVDEVKKICIDYINSL